MTDTSDTQEALQPDHDFIAFVAEVEAFLSEGICSKSKLGVAVTGDTKWVNLLRTAIDARNHPRKYKGKKVPTTTYDTARRARIIMAQRRTEADETQEVDTQNG